MKPALAIYMTLAVLGVAAAVLVPLATYRSDSAAVPFWRTAVGPGPLSTAHAFLGSQCESCHTPNKGIAAASCLTCHATDMPVLARQSTAFHATVQECRGCHVEHQGANVRPTRIDHSMLTQVGIRASSPMSGPPLATTSDAIAIRRFLAGVTGDRMPTDAQALDCRSCHAFRDIHQTFFGRECADCHGVDTWKIAGYLHPSPRSEECAQCHNPPPSHRMMHFAMMDQGITGQRGARVEQCYACHLTDAWNEIKGVGWFKMH